MEPSAPSNPRATTAVVGTATSYDVGDMKLARVGEHRVAVIRTAAGFYAIDNACPHQGYGLVTGSLDGDVVTCQWHNWKFRASDGKCLVGEEDVRCHAVDMKANGDIAVTVTTPSPEQERTLLWPSLERGFDNDYRGQMARDTVRLLTAGARPDEIVASGVVRSQAREPWGVGHGIAMAVDCLALSDRYTGDEAALPVVQALTAMSEPTRGRPPITLTPADSTIDLATAIEAQDDAAAVAATRALLASEQAEEALLATYAEAVGRHHLSYGHGAIYVQKCFEMLDRIGWNHADHVLPHLTRALVYATREDELPYMRRAAGTIAAADTIALAQAPCDPGWGGRDRLVEQFLDAAEAPIEAAIGAIGAGAGVTGVLDAVSLAVSHRLLRFDLAVEFDAADEFGWLDITHGLTYANAARWLWKRHPGSDAARLALHTVFLAHDTGRAERTRPGFTAASVPPARPGDVASAVLGRRPADAVAHALAAPPEVVARALAETALADRSGSWIVTAHVVKMAVAAAIEAQATSSALPLAAAARFAAAPRLERFVASSVAAALDFVRSGAPPRR